MPTGIYKRTKKHKKNWFKKGHKVIGGFKRGKNHPNWKGGQLLHTRGYILIYKPNHPFCNKDGYILRSHLVMEKMIKRLLKPEEIVHHKGTKYPMGSYENRGDDRPENLQLFATGNEHQKFHHPKGSKFGARKKTYLTIPFTPQTSPCIPQPYFQLH